MEILSLSIAIVGFHICLGALQHSFIFHVEDSRFVAVFKCATFNPELSLNIKHQLHTTLRIFKQTTLPPSQTLLQVRHRVYPDKGRSVHPHIILCHVKGRLYLLQESTAYSVCGCPRFILSAVACSHALQTHARKRNWQTSWLTIECRSTCNAVTCLFSYSDPSHAHLPALCL